jgi:hypothetical protein
VERLSIHVMPERAGGHTHVRVFAGPDADHRAMCGELVFTNEEWDLLAPALPDLGLPTHPIGIRRITVAVDEVTSW